MSDFVARFGIAFFIGAISYVLKFPFFLGIIAALLVLFIIDGLFDLNNEGDV